jgi:hypothetical protein
MNVLIGQIAFPGDATLVAVAGLGLHAPRRHSAVHARRERGVGENVAVVEVGAEDLLDLEIRHDVGAFSRRRGDGNADPGDQPGKAEGAHHTARERGQRNLHWPNP